jgi:hypothetical protein
LEEISLSIEEIVALLLGRSEKINSHQFRKFFAYFFLRRHCGNLDALRRHFRHVSREMIWAYAKDALGARHLAEEKKDLAAEIANAVVFDGGYRSTGVARHLREVKESLLLGAKVLSAEDAATYIETRIKQDFVEVHPMEWGYCLYQRGETGAACEAKVGPIEARAEPGVCGRCKFLCTGAENVDFWRHSGLLHQQLVDHPRSTKIMREESQKYVSVAASIVNRHAPREETGGKNE